MIPRDALEQLAGPELADEMGRQFGLEGAVRTSLERTLAYVDQVYESGRAHNAHGESFEIGLSPVPRVEGRTLMALAIEHSARRTLEVGLSFGMSALHFLMAHEVNDGEVHFAIDPFQDSEPYFGCGRSAVASQGLAKRFRWLEGPSALELPGLLREQERFDLCFIDGSHIFSDMFVDAYFCNAMLRPGGLLVLHDSWLDATRTLSNILTSNLGYVPVEERSVGMLAVLRNENEGRTNWVEFTEAFAPFEVAGKRRKRHRSPKWLRSLKKLTRRSREG